MYTGELLRTFYRVIAYSIFVLLCEQQVALFPGFSGESGTFYVPDGKGRPYLIMWGWSFKSISALKASTVFLAMDTRVKKYNDFPRNVA